MPTMVMGAMALATEAMVDTVWDMGDMVLWDIPDSAPMVPMDMLVPMDTAVLDTGPTTLERGLLMLSQRLRPNPRLMPMPGMVPMVLDTTEAMVDTVWVWDTAPTD